MVQDVIEAGRRMWFEYHCLESHDSSDAQLWYRSHQQVVVLRVANQESLHEGTTKLERGNEGIPLTYQVRLDNGFEFEVFEDELLTTEAEYIRPNPPRPR